jgi:hypothetical protein
MSSFYLVGSVGAVCNIAEIRTGKVAPTQTALKGLSGFQATEKKPAATTKITERMRYAQLSSGRLCPAMTRLLRRRTSGITAPNAPHQKHAFALMSASTRVI